MATAPFIARFTGPEGSYSVEFEPLDAHDGTMKVEINGEPMIWHVDFVEVNDNGRTILGGLTRGSESIWGDCYWFNMQAGGDAPFIEYWGNQVLWRRDQATV